MDGLSENNLLQGHVLENHRLNEEAIKQILAEKAFEIVKGLKRDYSASARNYFDIVLHPTYRFKLMFHTLINIEHCKRIIKTRILEHEKGTAPYAEFVDLARAIHSLEKSQRFIELFRHSVVDIVNEALQKRAIEPDGKAFILANLTNALNNINVKIEHEFIKQIKN